MIVRSMQDAGERRHEKRRRNRDEDRHADMVRASALHDVGRVGAEHHQLAVSHVDDAHDAERDRQADRDRAPAPTQAQAEEQRLDRRNRTTALLIDASRPLSPRPCARLRRFRRTRRRRFARAAPPAGCGHPDSSRLESVAIASSRAAASAPSRAASARPVSISRFDRRVGLDALPLLEKRDGRFVERPEHFAARPSRRTAASGLDKAETRDTASAARAAAGCSCRSWSGRRAARCRRA